MTREHLVQPWQDHRLDVLMSTPLHVYMGLREIDPERPELGLTLNADPKLVNNSSMLHGGMIATALDCAAAHAIFPHLADREVVLTNSFAISYLRPVPGGSDVTIRARIVKRGRTSAFIQAEVTLGEKTIATAQIVKAIVTLDEAPQEPEGGAS